MFLLITMEPGNLKSKLDFNKYRTPSNDVKANNEKLFRNRANI